MGRSNYDKPFYVDVGTSLVAIRCASNCDVIMTYNHVKCPKVIQFAKDTCDMMNKEAEIGRPLRNCDVGTPQEQAKRFMNYCKSKVCKRNVCHSCGYEELFHHECFPIWGQLPYEEVKNGD